MISMLPDDEAKETRDRKITMATTQHVLDLANSALARYSVRRVPDTNGKLELSSPSEAQTGRCVPRRQGVMEGG